LAEIFGILMVPYSPRNNVLAWVNGCSWLRPTAE
jgi:hypothetical protein